MRALVALVILVLVLLATVAEPLRPKAELDTPVDVVGAATGLRLVARDRGTGLSRVEVRVIPQGAEPVVLASESYPKLSWYGSGVHEATLTPVLDVAARRIPEGPATLEVWARDHSWLAMLQRSPLVTRAITIDVTPPNRGIL